MKIGNFGTGKTRKRIVVEGDGCCGIKGTSWGKFIIITLCTMIVAFLAFSEYQFFGKMESLKLVEKNTIILAEGESGIETIKRTPEMYENSIVFLSGIKTTTDGHAYDSDFELEFPEAGSVQRVPLYCQWAEHSTTSRKKVGEDSDGKAIYEETTKYYYLKNWRHSRISSLFFDSPIAYHNPQRDPFPGYKKNIGAVIGNNADISIAPGLLKLKPTEKGLIPRDLKVSSYAEKNGVTQHDGVYIYSKHKKGTATKLLHSLGTFFVDRVVDFGIEGSCNPGDIKVSFDIQRYFPEYSLVGKVRGNSIVPFALGNGSDILVSAGGKKPMFQVIGEFASDLKRNLWIVRAICVGSVIILGIIFMFIKPSKKKNINLKQKQL